MDWATHWPWWTHDESKLRLVVGTPARFARCLANFQVDELLLLKKSVQRMEELDMAPGEAMPAPTTDCPEGELQPESKTGSQMPERMALMADR